jgi:hypothetical protein
MASQCVLLVSIDSFCPPAGLEDSSSRSNVSLLPPSTEIISLLREPESFCPAGFGPEPLDPNSILSCEMRDRTRVSSRSIRPRTSMEAGLTLFCPETFEGVAAAYEQLEATASPLTRQFWHGLSRLHLSLLLHQQVLARLYPQRGQISPYFRGRELR